MPIGSIAAARRRASGVGAAPSSTQWRLYFPTGCIDKAASNLQLATVEMRGSSGGADQCTGGTAAASSEFANFEGSKAFDANGGTTWKVPGPNSGVGATLQYTFTGAVSVLELVIVATASSGAPESFQLQYYNGSTWVTVYTSPTYVAGDWTTPFTKTYTFTLPSFSVNPSITNTSGFTPGAVGDTLTFSAGTYSGSPEVAYAKKNNGSTFDTTISNYVLVSGDSGDTISFDVTLSNPAGSVTASASIGPIAASPTFVTQTVTMSDGSTVTLSDGSDLEMYNRTA